MRRATEPIREYMTPTVQTIGVTASLAEARRSMKTHRVRHLPVVDGAKLVGLISQRDIVALEARPHLAASTACVQDAMAEVPYAVSPDTPLREVVQVMSENKYGSVVVIENEQIRGIFTTVDAMSVLSELLLHD
jgi:acetoin utilization protein AcuB